jgi:hypothetical protein
VKTLRVEAENSNQPGQKWPNAYPEITGRPGDRELLEQQGTAMLLSNAQFNGSPIVSLTMTYENGVSRTVTIVERVNDDHP